MSIIKRIASLRSLMKEKCVDGILIYGTDPHLSEYVPNSWRSREWISGFTGSYGKVAITSERAALWTDSRYFIQAQSQLSGTQFELIRDLQADTISVDCWLSMELESGSSVVTDGLSISAAQATALELKLGAKGISLILNMCLVSLIWKDRPGLPQDPVVDYPVIYAGRSRTEKLAMIRDLLVKNGAGSTLICQLDDLAWSFNLRGNDISYNPLFVGYGYIDQHQAILFVKDGKIPQKLIKDLRKDGVRVMNYESIYLFLANIVHHPCYLDPERTNSLIYRQISTNCEIIKGLAIPTLLKSIKNEVEIAGMRNAHCRDGVAIVNFLYWFSECFGKEKITELTIAGKLNEFRSAQKYFMGESFCPIIAFGSHGAIVHYSVTPETDVDILPDGILLIDSGGQYLDGTTDITRTIATGKATEKQQSDFTLILKGLVQLAKAVFPANTRGYSLDILARKALWNNGLNYGHGTGHGVGHYSSVHEGPMAIRPEYNTEPIQAGQILTNEPGLYREGEYGIRIENVMECINEIGPELSRFLSFNTITLCPIDRRLVNRVLLTREEEDWLNEYHTRVFNELEFYLLPEVQKWLKTQCAPI
jgi:Xaa-Pro aminopeptidase